LSAAGALAVLLIAKDRSAGGVVEITETALSK
jgi:hypothetical protein